MENIIEIKNINVSLEEEGTQIIKNLSLSIPKGEVHAILGPNGAGKSTLAAALAGKPGYETDGEAIMNGKNLLELDVDERANEGLFMAFQHPIDLEGISIVPLLLASLKKKSDKKEAKLRVELARKTKQIAEKLEIPKDMLMRGVNVGFSGGERKRFEMLQMLSLEPKLAILDETDSGLDADALKIVCNAINEAKEQGISMLVISHSAKMLHKIQPDKVHVIVDGTIKKSGDMSLVDKIERDGYAKILTN